MSIEIFPAYLSTKIAAAVGGMLGGLTMFAFMKPKTILDATIRGGVCTGAAIIGSPVLLTYLKLATTFDFLLFAGAVIGFLAWGILSMTARVFIKAEANNKDLVDVAIDLKDTKPKNDTAK